VVEELRLVRRAELAREIRLRAAARASIENASPIERRALANAAELAALHTERFGTRLADGEEVESILGARPSDAAARFSYDRAVAAFRPSGSEVSRAPEPDLEL
jgi:hypothetical protein